MKCQKHVSYVVIWKMSNKHVKKVIYFFKQKVKRLKTLVHFNFDAIIFRIFNIPLHEPGLLNLLASLWHIGWKRTVLGNTLNIQTIKKDNEH